MTRTKRSRPAFTLLVGAAGCWTLGCTAAFGPGYTVAKQEINVRFVSAPEPIIRVNALYQLRNTGNQPLSFLEVRLPGRRWFHVADPKALWDAHTVSFDTSPLNPRNVLLRFPEPWTMSTSHTLRLSVDFQRAQGDENTLSFSPDGFFLPAQGWSPELLPARGSFATGGGPPKTWDLVVHAPSDFLIHTSGQVARRGSKNSRKADERIVVAVQQAKDAYPFVIAGRYKTTQQSAQDETVNLWTHSPQNVDALREPLDALARTMRAYDAMFGKRAPESHQLWVVQCPAIPGCFAHTASNYAAFLFEQDEKPSAEMASLDTVMVDLSRGTPVIAAAAAPSLAASWLGYDQNPGFFEQAPPLSALPAFAAAQGREAVQGPQVRKEIIRRALSAVPSRSSTRQRQPESDAILRAKSFLFFYALQDRYGPDTFNKAISHVLSARRGHAFDLDDVIAAFEQEVHQGVAEFVRLWMKQPGVPEEFRSRYEASSAAIAVSSMEATQ